MKKTLLILATALISTYGFCAGSKDNNAPWLENPYYSLNENDYIAATGTASDLESAKKTAINEVSSAIVQNINAETAVSQSATSKKGSDFSTYLLNVTTTSKVNNIAGLSIRETKKTKDGTCHAWAVLDKSKAAKYYSLEISKNSMEIETLLDSAEKNPDIFSACKDISKALEIAGQNDSYMTILSAIRPESRKILSYGSSAEVEAKLKNKFSTITIAVKVSGDNENKVYKAFSATINEIGIKTISENNSSTPYLLESEVTVEPLDSDDKSIYFSRVTLSASLKDTSTGKNLMTYMGNKRDGKLSAKEAASASYRSAEKLISSDFAAKLKELF